MKHHFIEKQICYTGEELRSHWIYQETGAVGDVIAAFIGSCDVPLSNMVDLHDVRNNAPIASRSMLHFLAEHFGCDLEKGILRQRLLITNLGEALREYPACAQVIRKGDDLFEENRKLSVSIATASPVSCCIHAGVNIESKGTPVPTKGLADYGIDPAPFAHTVMERYCNELEGMEIARCKVRPVQ